MRPGLAISILVSLAGGCRDHAGTARDRAAPAPAVVRAATAPELPAASAIDGLDSVPPGARDRLVTVVQAVEHDRREAFLSAVSMGGFAVGNLALIAEQVEGELAGRSVAELTELPCTDGCRWRVQRVEPKRIDLEARDARGALGVLTLIHEDDDSWGVVSAHRS